MKNTEIFKELKNNKIKELSGEESRKIDGGCVSTLFWEIYLFFR